MIVLGHQPFILFYFLFFTLNLFKGACSDPQPYPIPPTFFKHMKILVPEVESYLEGFVCEIL